MADYRPGTADQAAFLAALLERGHLIDGGVPGLYGRGADFEAVRLGFEELVSRAGAGDGPELLRFPPVLPRKYLETNSYLTSFPHLAGALFTFDGDEAAAKEQAARAEAHEDWSEHQHMSELAMVPAACYPAYPAIAARGPLAPGGVTLDLGGSYVFRSEPSGDPARLQMFHQREMVRIGEPEAVAEWRNAWRDRAIDVLRSIGLDANFAVATDPFFGRSGRMLAANQRTQELKFEILVPIATDGEPTAVASFNYHQEHFSGRYDIRMADGSPAHTACLGFGHERVVLALMKTHGLEPATWPDAVRGKLWPAAS